MHPRLIGHRRQHQFCAQRFAAARERCKRGTECIDATVGKMLHWLQALAQVQPTISAHHGFAPHAPTQRVQQRRPRAEHPRAHTRTALQVAFQQTHARAIRNGCSHARGIFEFLVNAHQLLLRDGKERVDAAAQNERAKENQRDREHGGWTSEHRIRADGSYKLVRLRTRCMCFRIGSRGRAHGLASEGESRT